MIIKTFKTKPSTIQAVKFDKNLIGKLEDMKIFIRSTEDGPYQIYNPKQGSWININEGDWIRVDLKDDHYPIANDYMMIKYNEEIE